MLTNRAIHRGRNVTWKRWQVTMVYYIYPTHRAYEKEVHTGLWCRWIHTHTRPCTGERREACSPASLGCGRVITISTVLHSRHEREEANL